VLHILISFEGILGLPIVYQFNKGGNCKLQGGLFIFIRKSSMGIFNIGGNCKLQFPQMKGGCVTINFIQIKFALFIPHPPSHCLNEMQHKGGCGILIPPNDLVVSKWG
jgi:hypothetical protein